MSTNLNNPAENNHTPELIAALKLLLDQVDYTVGACRLTDMVGACLDHKVIKRVRAVIAKAEGKA